MERGLDCLSSLRSFQQQCKFHSIVTSNRFLLHHTFSRRSFDTIDNLEWIKLMFRVTRNKHVCSVSCILPLEMLHCKAQS